METRYDQSAPCAVETDRSALPLGLPALSGQLLRDLSLLGGRVGIIGGSFDPVHESHLEIARAAMEAHRLDVVVFVPAAHNPLKEHSTFASDAQRLEMLLAAVTSEPRFLVSPHEIAKGGESFTVELLRDIHRAAPAIEALHFIVGADCLAHLHRWHEVDRFLELSRLVPVGRGGGSEQLGTLDPSLARHHQTLKERFVPYGGTLASRELRSSLALGVMPAGIPDGVREVIERDGIYGFSAANNGAAT